ncbi:MAG: hypothetical protein HKN49_13870 [Gammaproteobacteria bacterium]|nr:hypothetical protein [Gammaproteobacteria bacterium]
MRMNLKPMVVVFIFVIAGCAPLATVESASDVSAAKSDLRLFAVEIKVGPNWDNSKAPNQQAFFAEHSSNLNRLREAGHIVMGARYSDIGLIIFSARSAEEVRGLMSNDASMAAGTFKYEVHALNVFYPGLVQSGSGS